jgi:hypothetical protein
MNMTVGSYEKYEELMSMPAADLVDYVMKLESMLRELRSFISRRKAVCGDNPDDLEESQ